MIYTRTTTLKRSRASPHSPGLQPGTLSTASRADDAVDVSHRQELSTSSWYCCCCEPEFDPALSILLIENRHDALDSPSTPCIRVPSPLAGGRNNVRELRAQRRQVLGDGGRGYSSTIGVPAVDYNGSSRNCCCIKYLVPGRWYVWSPCHPKKTTCLVLHKSRA